MIKCCSSVLFTFRNCKDQSPNLKIYNNWNFDGDEEGSFDDDDANGDDDDDDVKGDDDAKCHDDDDDDDADDLMQL